MVGLAHFRGGVFLAATTLLACAAEAMTPRGAFSAPSALG